MRQEYDWHAFSGVTTFPNVAAAGGVTTYDIGTTFSYAIKGIMYSKANANGNTTPTTDQNTSAAFVSLAASKGAMYVLIINAAGTVGAVQSDVVSLDASNVRLKNPNWPLIPDGFVPFASILIENGSTGSAWLFGSNNWNATGVKKLVENRAWTGARPSAGVTA